MTMNYKWNIIFQKMTASEFIQISIVMVLVYSRETVQLYEIPETKKLESQVTQLVELIRQPFQNEEAVQLYSDLAYQIYLELVPSEELRTRLKGKNITIIPDSFFVLFTI